MAFSRATLGMANMAWKTLMRAQSQRTDSVYAEEMTNAGTVGAYIIAKVTMLRPTVALCDWSGTTPAARTNMSHK
jgi:hypothetical protein